MFSLPKKIRFPLWQFLNQSIFDPSSKAILNPHRYWLLHQIQLLERCLVKEFISKDGRRDY
ncbi:hypothetical protein K9N68_24195 [Kovacikia minuta CCNUW1]|uniref:hypothetical protein n=1 Tax=Kovacikia minuta TaxID=2931930 RepID=UPI001CCC58A0|nr:hypothetical protein [Kovacikia minuta]UBF24745.1 hypothetical protein K9N68_24195 [Kovacikia minuta CCNUW1]